MSQPIPPARDDAPGMKSAGIGPWAQVMALPAIGLALLLGIAVVLLHVQQQLRDEQTAVAVADARTFLASVTRFRDFYTREIVSRAQASGIFITHNYRHIPNSLPLPATFTLDFADFISNDGAGFDLLVYSDLPFPWRESERTLDDFQRDAIARLRANPDVPVTRVDVRNGESILRVAVADRLESACVACHNTYRGSPKTDWEIGDMRGVFEVSRSLSGAEASLGSGVRNALFMSFLLIAASVMVLWFVMRRLHRSLRDSQHQAVLVQRTNEHLQDEVAQRRKTEAVLSFNEAKLRAIFDGVLEAIIVIDRKAIIVQANRMAETMFGFDTDGLTGLNVRLLMPVDDAAVHDEHVANCGGTQEARFLGRGRLLQGLRRDGSVFSINVAVNDVLFGDERCFVGIITDVTEQIEREAELTRMRDEALESTRLKSAFLANMSHEIRTPMNGVLGMTGLLQDTPLDDYQRDLIETVDRSGQSLLRIINDILDISKIEAGRLELCAHDFDPIATVSEVVKLFSVKADDKGLELSWMCDPQVERWVSGDEGRFRQVLTNLVGNAIKFSAAGQVTLSVAPGERPCQLCIDVRDEGMGIPEAAQHHLFQPFIQLDDSASRQFGGTGLGLAISRELIGMMGGSIRVESTLGVGSTFHFDVSFAPASKPPASTLATAPLLPPVADLDVAHARRRILVAEDNPVNQKLMTLLLKKLGYEIVLVDNGLKALQAQQSGEFDLVLMDCQMPVMDGFEATRAWRVREVSEGRRRVPIIAVTANAMEGDEDRCLAVDMDDYLTKPIEPTRLREKLAAWLGAFDGTGIDASGRSQT